MGRMEINLLVYPYTTPTRTTRPVAHGGSSEIAWAKAQVLLCIGAAALGWMVCWTTGETGDTWRWTGDPEISRNPRLIQWLIQWLTVLNPILSYIYLNRIYTYYMIIPLLTLWTFGGIHKCTYVYLMFRQIRVCMLYSVMSCECHVMSCSVMQCCIVSCL